MVIQIVIHTNTNSDFTHTHTHTHIYIYNILIVVTPISKIYQLKKGDRSKGPEIAFYALVVNDLCFVHLVFV